jgi:hypothetical protein
MHAVHVDAAGAVGVSSADRALTVFPWAYPLLAVALTSFLWTIIISNLRGVMGGGSGCLVAKGLLG